MSCMSKDWVVLVDLIEAIKVLYRICRNVVGTNNCKSKEFNIHVGVQHSGILSPRLSLALMDEDCKKIEKKCTWCNGGF